MPEKIEAVVSDIEGTVAPISFVAEKLFPYSRAHLPDFVRVHQNEPDVAEALAQIGGSTESAIKILLNWHDTDRKETPLKTIQGLIWAEGYRDGTLRGEIYPDAVERLRAWKNAGVRLFIYSSGSVAAQKLLFGYSDAGDLTSLFEDYFDTKIGAKIDPASYAAILKRLALPPGSVLFLSDSEKELDAAGSAGIRTACLAREGKAESSHPVHSDFTTLTI
jgi:enolase-phosphatase E1